MRLMLIAVVAAVAACDSPEAARVRGGGPGADTLNRGAVVLMHQGSKPFHNTPDLVPGKGAPVAAAQQAHRLSVP